MSAVRLPAEVLEESFQHLRACGGGKRECVLYWCGPVDEPHMLTSVVHPAHYAGPAGYEVDSAWVTQFFLTLRRARQAVRVQVHTHPRYAGHSETDDQFALVPARGFLSLVIPYFATGPVGLQRTHLVQMQADGTWAQVDAQEVLRVE